VQARLHIPQCVPLVCRSKHVPPQSVWPLGQVHMPLEQTRPPVQRLPQELQLALSVWVLTHDVPQAVWPAGHERMQLPPWQMRPAAHALPQVPQLARSVAVFTQLPLQLLWPD
jgi:hypothetical protein